MMQGDQYRLPMSVTMNGTAVTGEAVANVEVMLGSIRKTIEDGDIFYDPLQEAFLISLTQEDTFRLRGGVKVNLRCKFLSGDVIGADLGIVDISQSTSKVVL